jgi:hypothetical protein
LGFVVGAVELRRKRTHICLKRLHDSAAELKSRMKSDSFFTIT